MAVALHSFSFHASIPQPTTISQTYAAYSSPLSISVHKDRKLEKLTKCIVNLKQCDLYVFVYIYIMLIEVYCILWSLYVHILY